MIDILVDILKDTKEKNPLIHQITNYVTVNDCANVTLAIGASPAMADEEKEVESLVNIASSLYLNIGTINKRVKKSMLKATKRANKLGIPVVLDPVGIGASKFRKDLVDELLQNYKIAVVRGNISEIKAILNLSSKSKGADASLEDFLSVDGIGKVVAESLVAWFSSEDNLALLEKFTNLGVKPVFEEKKTGGKLNGAKFVITGTLAGISRDHMAEKIRELGGEFQKSITRETDFLLIGEKVGASKIAKAEKLGVKVISQAEFEAMIT